MNLEALVCLLAGFEHCDEDLNRVCSEFDGIELLPEQAGERLERVIDWAEDQPRSAETAMIAAGMLRAAAV